MGYAEAGLGSTSVELAWGLLSLHGGRLLLCLPLSGGWLRLATNSQLRTGTDKGNPTV